MVLSSKQVDHELDNWTQSLLESTGSLEVSKPRPTRRQQHQQQRQQPDPLKCPRCESMNTKFCYYNNYNKLQPRHFCKACKRHWTNGGTLRNVPVGGGRKNKRLKRQTATASTATTTTAPPVTTRYSSEFVVHNFPLGFGDHEERSKASGTKTVGSEGSDTQNFYTLNAPTNWDINGNVIRSTLQAPQIQSLGFPFSSLSSFDTNPTSVSCYFPSMTGYEYIEKPEAMEDSIVTSTTTIPSSTSTVVSDQQWQAPSTSSFMQDMPNYWNWNDVENMVSADLNIPWDE